MNGRVGLAIVLLAAAAIVSVAKDRDDDFEEILRFEVDQPSPVPSGWDGGPRETLFVEEEVVHAGRYAGRIVRDAESESEFSTLTKGIDVTFSGSKLELRAYLKTEDVVGWAGLWLRQDGDSGMVGFKNHEDLDLHGTNDWTEYSLELDLSPQAEDVFFGALLFGTGRVWVDDVQLLVDGKPVAEAPKRRIPKTALDLDTEFDGGSGITVAELSERQVEHVVRLGRVWGFLKYHHPAVTAGKHHWDYELFRILPAILKAADSKTANAALDGWIGGLGTIAPCECCAELPDDDIHLRPDLDWISDTAALGEPLSTALQAVYKNRDSRGQHFFVRPHIGVGHPDFRNESTYREIEFPDPGFQLLTLFRYWNIIEYWFPYRDVIGEDWHAVLVEYVPRMALATGREEVEAHLATLIARLNETHGVFHTAERPPKGKCALPVRLRMVEDRAVVVSFSHPELGPESGLAIGDVIESFDGKKVEDLLAVWAPYYNASNTPTRRDRMARVITVGDCGDVTIEGKRGKNSLRRTVARIPFDEIDRRAGWTHDRDGAAFQLLDDRVAYLKLSSVETALAADYVRGAAGTQGLIVDIRNYPAEFVVFSLGSRFVDKPTPFARFTKAHFSNPGLFTFTDSMVLTPQKPHYEGKIVILVDEVSISQAEYTTMALRAGPNAIVVGSTTAGADGNVSRIPLPGGMSTMISGIGVFYPDKRPTQRVGITPDIEIRPTVEGIRQGRDEVLERAIREILGKDATEAEVRRIAAVEDPG